MGNKNDKNYYHHNNYIKNNIDDINNNNGTNSNIIPKNEFILNSDNESIIDLSIKATNFFLDWSLELLERIYVMFKLLSEKLSDQELMLNLQSTLALLFQQVDDEIYDNLLTSVFNFVSQNNLPFAIDPVSTVCGSLASIHPNLALKKFFPFFYNQFIIINSENDKPILQSSTTSEFIWGLSILGKIFRVSGEHLLEYKKEISILLDLLILSPNELIDKTIRSTKV